MAKAKAKTPIGKKDSVNRELRQIEKVWENPARSEPLDPAGAAARVRTGWATRAPMFEARLDRVSEASRALYAKAKAFADAGMPRGKRDIDEQAAFFVVAAPANVQGAPRWPDFYENWIEDGGLAHAIAIALRLPATQHYMEGARSEVVLLPGTTDAYAFWVLAAFVPKVDALDASARAELRERVAPLAAAATPEATAALAMLFDDEAFAKDAIARADAASITYRHPWPVGLFEVLRSGDDFAHLLGRGACAFQFFGAGYVLRARERVGDAGIADAIVRFFAAAMAEPRRMHDMYTRQFAAIACVIPDPRLAWLFTEHGDHKFLAKHAPFYFMRNPDVRPERPSDLALGARMVPEPRPPRPAGYTKEELDALDPDAREERLISQLARGHLGASFALGLLAEYPTPRLAVAIAEKMSRPDFATQMPKPGFDKELKEDLAALAEKHPAIGEALSAAKKKKRAR
jgi:hypothetical protein